MDEPQRQPCTRWAFWLAWACAALRGLADRPQVLQEASGNNQGLPRITFISRMVRIEPCRSVPQGGRQTSLGGWRARGIPFPGGLEPSTRQHPHKDWLFLRSDPSTYPSETVNGPVRKWFKAPSSGARSPTVSGCSTVFTGVSAVTPRICIAAAFMSKRVLSCISSGRTSKWTQVPNHLREKEKHSRRYLTRAKY